VVLRADFPAISVLIRSVGLVNGRKVIPADSIVHSLKQRIIFLGVIGIDSSVINGAVNGVISIVTLGMVLWAWDNHRQTLNPN